MYTLVNTIMPIKKKCRNCTKAGMKTKWMRRIYWRDNTSSSYSFVPIGWCCPICNTSEITIKRDNIDKNLKKLDDLTVRAKQLQKDLL